MLVAVACVAMMAPAVFAGNGSGATFTTTTSTVLGTVVFTPSTNVNVSAISNDGGGTPPNTYCVASWHTAALNQSSGKEFAAISDSGPNNLTTGIVYTGLTGIMTGKPCTAVDAWPAQGASGWQQ